MPALVSDWITFFWLKFIFATSVTTAQDGRSVKQANTVTHAGNMEPQYTENLKTRACDRTSINSVPLPLVCLAIKVGQSESYDPIGLFLDEFNARNRAYSILARCPSCDQMKAHSIERDVAVMFTKWRAYSWLVAPVFLRPVRSPSEPTRRTGIMSQAPTIQVHAAPLLTHKSEGV